MPAERFSARETDHLPLPETDHRQQFVQQKIRDLSRIGNEQSHLSLGRWAFPIPPPAAKMPSSLAPVDFQLIAKRSSREGSKCPKIFCGQEGLADAWALAGGRRDDISCPE